MKTIIINRNILQHQRFLSEARDAEPEVLWVGDSLIQNLFNSRIWDSRYDFLDPKSAIQELWMLTPFF